MTNWLLQNVTLLPMDGGREAPLGAVRNGALRVRGAVIEAIGDLAPEPGERTVDGAGAVVCPSFVQGHVHCTQTLFRGLADDLALMPWLEQRIWPLEHAHDAQSTQLSAELTFAELLLGGTTAVQTMESVRHAEVVAKSGLASGLTVITGNCLMDQHSAGMPEGLATTASEALLRTDALRREFDGKGRVHIAVQPRFALSCSDDLARQAAEFAREHGMRIHTHAAEHKDEIAAVRRTFGRDYIELLADQGLLGERTSLAHCVHLTARERELLVQTNTAVLHCPSTNLKLGSGIAKIHEYDELGLRLALGADGAPCNNRLSMLTELRQAALLQSLVAGPGAWPAERALWTATRGGALALGLSDLGCLAPGFRADFLLWQLDAPFLGGPPAVRIVYGANEHHLARVVCGGETVASNGALVAIDLDELHRRARETLPLVLSRATLR